MSWTLVVSQQEVARTPAERVFGVPHPRLAAHALSYTAHDYPQMDLMPWRMTPLGVITVTIDLTAPLIRRYIAPDPLQGKDFPLLPVIGLRDRPLTLEQAGPSRGIGLGLTPLGVRVVRPAVAGVGQHERQPRRSARRRRGPADRTAR